MALGKRLAGEGGILLLGLVVLAQDLGADHPEFATCAEARKGAAAARARTRNLTRQMKDLRKLQDDLAIKHASVSRRIKALERSRRVNPNLALVYDHQIARLDTERQAIEVKNSKLSSKYSILEESRRSVRLVLRRARRAEQRLCKTNARPRPIRTEKGNPDAPMFRGETDWREVAGIDGNVYFRVRSAGEYDAATRSGQYDLLFWNRSDRGIFFSYFVETYRGVYRSVRLRGGRKSVAQRWRVPAWGSSLPPRAIAARFKRFATRPGKGAALRPAAPGPAAHPQGENAMAPVVRSATKKIPDGPSVRRHPNGKTRWQGEYRSGKRHGRWVFYYPTGLKRSEGTYEQGLKHGTWTFYHARGGVSKVGEYSHGAKHGRRAGWYAGGKSRFEGRFERDRKTGQWAYYWSSGTMRAQGSYVEGRKHGYWSYWTRQGVRVRPDRLYERGKRS